MPVTYLTAASARWSYPRAQGLGGSFSVRDSRVTTAQGGGEGGGRGAGKHSLSVAPLAGERSPLSARAGLVAWLEEKRYRISNTPRSPLSDRAGLASLSATGQGLLALGTTGPGLTTGG